MDVDEVSHAHDATLLRKVNESAILEVIRRQGPMTRAEIARLLHLSLPTITRIVTGLIENGLVLERSHASSRGGRRPTLLEFNNRAALIIGVYVGQNVAGALADLGGQILVRRTIPALAGEAGVVRLIEFAEELRREAVALGLPVRGVGVGAPSIVTFRDGTVAWAPALGWRNLPLRTRLEEALKLPVFVENEVNVIALGERSHGAGQGRRNLVCISLGAGIGAGLILDGQLFRGSHDASGEVGYLIPSPAYLGRTYDTFGCLESLAGSTGLVEQALARLRAGEPSLLGAAGPGGGSVKVEEIFAAARVQDRLACAVVEEMVDHLGIMLVALACILDPELIIINGEMAEFGDVFVEPLRARIQGLMPFAPAVVLSELRMDAAVIGAVAIALHETGGGLFVQPTRA